MVSITKARDEERARDRKRKRLLLQIGPKKYHLSQKEGRRLRGQLNRMTLTG